MKRPTMYQWEIIFKLKNREQWYKETMFATSESLAVDHAKSIKNVDSYEVFKKRKV